MKFLFLFIHLFLCPHIHSYQYASILVKKVRTFQRKQCVFAVDIVPETIPAIVAVSPNEELISSNGEISKLEQYALSTWKNPNYGPDEIGKAWRMTESLISVGGAGVTNRHCNALIAQLGYHNYVKVKVVSDKYNSTEMGEIFLQDERMADLGVLLERRLKGLLFARHELLPEKVVEAYPKNEEDEFTNRRVPFRKRGIVKKPRTKRLLKSSSATTTIPTTSRVIRTSRIESTTARTPRDTPDYSANRPSFATTRTSTPRDTNTNTNTNNNFRDDRTSSPSRSSYSSAGGDRGGMRNNADNANRRIGRKTTGYADRSTSYGDRSTSYGDRRSTSYGDRRSTGSTGYAGRSDTGTGYGSRSGTSSYGDRRSTGSGYDKSTGTGYSRGTGTGYGDRRSTGTGYGGRSTGSSYGAAGYGGRYGQRTYGSASSSSGSSSGSRRSYGNSNNDDVATSEDFRKDRYSLGNRRRSAPADGSRKFLGRKTGYATRNSPMRQQIDDSKLQRKKMYGKNARSASS